MDATPFQVAREWLAQFRDENPEHVFILNTDNALPFDRNIPVYSPETKSQHLQIGVNEKLAINVARGIANAGGFPIYTTPATHLQVVAEDLLHCALAKDAVLLIGIFAGVDLTFWGPSHTSHRDVLLFSFPEVSIFQPATADDVRIILAGIYQNPQKYLPGYIRLPSMPFMKISTTSMRWVNFAHAFANGFYWFENDLPGEADILFIASGTTLKECLNAATELEKHHLKATVVNVVNLQSVNGPLLSALTAAPKRIISAIDADPSVMTNLLWRHLPPLLRHKIISRGVSDFSKASYTKASVFARHGIDAAGLVTLALSQSVTADSDKPRKRNPPIKTRTPQAPTPKD
jgi:transketolase C-terminal domain/subunit